MHFLSFSLSEHSIAEPHPYRFDAVDELLQVVYDEKVCTTCSLLHGKGEMGSGCERRIHEEYKVSVLMFFGGASRSGKRKPSLWDIFRSHYFVHSFSLMTHLTFTPPIPSLFIKPSFRGMFTPKRFPLSFTCS